MQRIANGVVAKQGQDLSMDRLEEGLIYANANSNVIFHEEMSLTANQKKKKSEQKRLANK